MPARCPRFALPEMYKSSALQSFGFGVVRQNDSRTAKVKNSGQHTDSIASGIGYSHRNSTVQTAYRQYSKRDWYSTVTDTTVKPAREPHTEQYSQEWSMHCINTVQF